MKQFWRYSHWISRLILILPTLIFALISWKNIRDPVHAAVGSGVSLGAGVGITNWRVGFGAFPLAFAIIILFCVASKRRLFMGLGFVAMIMVVALTVRVFGMLADNTTSESVKLVVAELVFLTLSVIGFSIEYGRRRHEPPDFTHGSSSSPADASCRAPS